MRKISTYLLLVLVSALLVSCVAVKVPNEIVDEKNVDSPVVEQPIDEKIEKVTLTLYFPDNEALYLYKELREVELPKDSVLAEIVLEELFKGPVSDNLSPSLDGENVVNSVIVSDGVCTVDFKKDFALLNSGGSTRESFAVGSIVNSLCELEDVDEVKINIDGDTNAVFGGHFTLEFPFAAQKDLIAE